MSKFFESSLEIHDFFYEYAYFIQGLIQNTRIEIVAEFSILIENSATIFFVYILYGRYFHIWDSRLGVREILKKCQHFEKVLNMEENISKYGSFFLNIEEKYYTSVIRNLPYIEKNFHI